MAIDTDIFNLDNISAMTIAGENDNEQAEIVSDPEVLEQMSLAAIKRNKDNLANMKQRLMFSLDKRKMAEAQKLISGMENIGYLFSDPEVLERVKENTKSAMDLKFLADAYSRMLESQKKLMQLDSVDGSGTAAQISLAVKFKGSNGNEVQSVISAEV